MHYRSDALPHVTAKVLWPFAAKTPSSTAIGKKPTLQLTAWAGNPKPIK